MTISSSDPVSKEDKFVEAAQKSDGKTLIALFDQGVSVNAKNSHGVTALHWASLNGDVAMVRFLVSTGADMNTKNEAGGFTALHNAAYMGCAEVTDLLIERGASLDEKDLGGCSPLEHAQKAGEPETIRLLQEAPERRRLLAEKIAQKEAAVLEKNLARARILSRDVPAPKPFKFK